MLVHASGSSVGVALMQLAVSAGAIVIATAGEDDKLEAVCCVLCVLWFVFVQLCCVVSAFVSSANYTFVLCRIFSTPTNFVCSFLSFSLSIYLVLSLSLSLSLALSLSLSLSLFIPLSLFFSLSRFLLPKAKRAGASAAFSRKTAWDKSVTEFTGVLHSLFFFFFFFLSFFLSFS